MTNLAAAPDGMDWRAAVVPYVGADTRRAALQVVTTIVPLVLAMAAAVLAVRVSVPLALPLVPLIALLLVRTFVLMHDCAHGSFFGARALNDAVGFVTGVITLTPFDQWRRDHALHHASSGDLDRRGHGDVPTLTVREYAARSRTGRLLYRVVRHPVLLMFGGPFHLAIGQRLRGRGPATGPKQLRSVWATNAAIVVLLFAGVLALGWKAVLIAYVLPYYLAAMAGVFLFYVQHQFEEAYWTPHAEWEYAEAALRGSSHLMLPPLLRWFTGNIGLHHVHHAAPRIPNYRLQRCHDENAVFQQSPVVTLRSGIKALSLALWDEDRRRLVRFSDVRAGSTAGVHA